MERTVEVKSPDWLAFREHAPFAPAPEQTPVSALRATGCPGEMLSLAVALRAGDDVDELVLAAPVLRADTGAVIAPSAIEVFVVHTWEQAGLGVYQSGPRRVAELLLKDDRIAPRDGYAQHCGHWRHALRRGAFYRPPELRLTGAVRTALRAGTPKQCWLAVHLPPDATPGIYHGAIEVDGGAGRPPARLPVAVEVLPLALAAPRQDVFLWYRGTLDCRQPRNFVPAPRFEAQLRDIRAHGFRSISLREGDERLLQRALDIARAAGFRDRIVLTEPFPNRWTGLDFHAMTPCYYLSDEIDHRGEHLLGAHRRNWREARDRGVRTMCALTQQPFARRLLDPDDLGHPPDAFLYYLPRNLTYFAVHASFPGARTRPVYYYWHGHMEKPLLHRVLAGVYLWKSGADGIAPYCYQDLPEPPFSPFDDFDEWDSRERAASGGHGFKDHMTTYPARSGSIPTLQWKGLSAGVFDLMYLATLAALGEQAPARGGAAADCAREARAAVAEFMERISLTRIEIVSDTETAPYPDLHAADLDAFRARLARDCVELSRLL